MKNELLEIYKEQDFEEIKHINDEETEYIDMPESLLKFSNMQIKKTFLELPIKQLLFTKKMITTQNTISFRSIKWSNWILEQKEKTEDYILTRYICYLIVQNADFS